MMPDIILLKVKTFHQNSANRFSTARKKPVAPPPPPSLNKVKKQFKEKSFGKKAEQIAKIKDS